MAQNYKTVGNWWNARDIELIEKNGEIYRLDGWNGYQYNDCWKCGGKYNMDVIEEGIVIVPVYSEDDDIIDYEIY